MQKNKIVMSLIFIAIMQGCASLSKEECQGGDWAGIGYRDGSRGLSESRFNDHSKACADYKIKPDFSAYQNGHQRGLVQVYCKPRKAYYEGLNGRGYGNVCPSHLEGTFLTAYRYGRDIYKLQQNASRIRGDITATNSRIAALDQKIDGLRHQIQYTRAPGIKHHIEDELDQLEDRLKVKIPRAWSKLQLTNQLQHQFYAMLNLAEKRGGYQTRLDWIRDYSHHVKPGSNKAKQIRRKIRDLDHQISDVKARLARHSKGPKPVKRLNHLIELAEYTGALQKQLKILSNAHNKHERRDLAKFHYQYELDEIKRHSQHSSPSSPHQQGKTRQQLRRELREARLSRDRELHLRDDLSDQLRLLEQDIQHQKATSPYR